MSLDSTPDKRRHHSSPHNKLVYARREGDYRPGVSKAGAVKAARSMCLPNSQVLAKVI